MANQEHLDILEQGVKIWNQWREEHPEFVPDLKEASLKEKNLKEVNFTKADLQKANLKGADLTKANLRGADLSYAILWDTILSEAVLNDAILVESYLYGANLTKANLTKALLFKAWLEKANLSDAELAGVHLGGADLADANLRGAKLTKATLNGTSFAGADLSEADLSGSDLSWSNLSGANLSHTNLTGCRIYATSAWNVQLEGAIQSDLIITNQEEPIITVDSLKIAQFIYLLLNNEQIREVINTLTMKAVLILGRFTPERKVVLEALREVLRRHNYIPILFDFEKPSSRSFTETVRTLADLARFIIADLTDPSSIPQELQAIIPTLAIPVQPILLEGKKAYAMFVDFSLYPWVLPIHFYNDQTNLLATLKEKVIEPAEQKAQELEKRKNM
jgi:uncharacterized protein YjbI with pentapeptide repeats